MSRSSHFPLVPAPFRSSVHAANVGPSIAAAPRETGESAARRRFVAARHKLGLSQHEAAKLLNASFSALADWERGAARIPAWALIELEGRVAA